MRRYLTNTLALALAAFLVTPALAKDTMKDARPPESTRVLGERILEEPVEGLGGGSLGEVADLVIDADAGRVAFLVVDLEDSDRLLAVPFDQVRILAASGDALSWRINLLNSDPKLWPEFGENAWEDEESRGTIDRLLRSYGTKQEGIAKDPGRMIRFTEFEDYDLEDSERDDVGDVEDVVFDSRTGRIEEILVSSGGFLGLGESVHTIPWKMTRLEEENAVAVRMTEENRDRIASFEVSKGEEARLRWLEERLKSAERGAAVSPQPVLLAVRFEPKEIHRYEVRAESPNDALVADLPGPDGDDGWTAVYVIRAVKIDDAGDATLDVVLTPKNGAKDAEPLRFRAVVTPDGEVKDVVRTDSAAMDVGEGENRVVRSHLALICGGGLTGRELAKDAELGVPTEVESWCCAPDELQRKVTYRVDGEVSDEEPVRVVVLADKAQVGHAVYGPDGMLDEIVLKPDGEGTGRVLRIRSTD